MLQAEGKKPLKKYIDKRQAKVTEWVALRPIFEVCAKDTSYEVGGGVLGAVAAAGHSLTTAEGNVKRYFGGSKGAAVTGIWKA